MQHTSWPKRKDYHLTADSNICGQVFLCDGEQADSCGACDCK